ncbi:MAG: hypothetical protein Q7R35_07145, partial [Elusimicrobiota bacterium]|nr:hypothetical protein [Elusimicrobiota bacterium]
QCCRRIRGARLDWRPRMAVTWLFKDAGLVCAVCADLAGLIIVKSGRGSSAAFAEGKGSATVRKAVSSYVKPSTSTKTWAYCDDFKVASL